MRSPRARDRRRAHRKLRRRALLVSALATVFIVSGSLAFGSEIFAFANAKMSQLAAVGEIKSTAPKSCEDAIKRAVQKQGENDGTYTSIDSNPTKQVALDKCFGAVLKGGAQRPYKNKDYECTGRTGTAEVTSKKVTSITTASKKAPKGECKLKITGEYDGKKALPTVGKMPQSDIPPRTSKANETVWGAKSELAPTNQRIGGVFEVENGLNESAKPETTGSWYENLKDYLSGPAQAAPVESTQTATDYLKSASGKLGEGVSIAPGSTPNPYTITPLTPDQDYKPVSTFDNKATTRFDLNNPGVRKSTPSTSYVNNFLDRVSGFFSKILGI